MSIEALFIFNSIKIQNECNCKEMTFILTYCFLCIICKMKLPIPFIIKIKIVILKPVLLYNVFLQHCHFKNSQTAVSGTRHYTWKKVNTSTSIALENS